MSEVGYMAHRQKMSHTPALQLVLFHKVRKLGGLITIKSAKCILSTASDTQKKDDFSGVTVKSLVYAKLPSQCDIKAQICEISKEAYHYPGQIIAVQGLRKILG